MSSISMRIAMKLTKTSLNTSKRLINKIDAIQESIENETCERRRDVETINEKLDRILTLLLSNKNESDFTKYRTNTFVNSVIPKPSRQKSSNDNENSDNDFEAKNRNNQIEVREYDNSQQMLNDVMGSKLQKQANAKDSEEDNQVKPFVKEEFQETPAASLNKSSKSNSPKKSSFKEEPKEVQKEESFEEESKTAKDEEDLINDIINDWTSHSAKEESPAKANPKDLKKEAPISHESIKFCLDRSRSEEMSESSQKVAISESKIYRSEDEFMQSIMEEIKEESSNIASSKESNIKPNKDDLDSEFKKTLKSKRKNSSRRNIIPDSKPEVDPLELLSKEYDIVDKTVEGSSDFQDTIIGSQFMMKYNSKDSRQSEKRNKENKVPPLRIKQQSKYNNNILSLEDSENMIDMLLSEEGEIKEEMIIQISEKSANKHPHVRIKNSNLVKVDPVERFQEIMRNSRKNNDEFQVEPKSKNKPNDYMLKNVNDEESVKLEDLIGPIKSEDWPTKNQNSMNTKPRKQISGGKANKPNKERYK